jgi:hypothetical protein
MRFELAVSVAVARVRSAYASLLRCLGCTFKVLGLRIPIADSHSGGLKALNCYILFKCFDGGGGWVK